MLRRGLRGEVRDKGWYEGANYSTQGQNARALVDIVRQARGRGIEPVIVLLPESSPMRASIPVEAMGSLRAVLRGAFGLGSPAVVNLRDSIPDAQFHDNVHPRRAGRQAATRTLIEAIGHLPAE